MTSAMAIGNETLDLIISKTDARPAGNGWSARCPAHEDHNASLSIGMGDNGGIVVHCHAGCSVEAVLSALNLTMKDLMPPCDDRPQNRNGKPKANGKPATNGKPKPKRTAPLYMSVDRAVEAMSRWAIKPGRLPDFQYSYHDATGNEVGRICRWNTPGDKIIRPVTLNGCGWSCKGMPAPRPLYRLPEVMQSDIVAVAEGEPAADALRSLGFTATTSVHGAKSPSETDWSPSRGKVIPIWPDNDKAGADYAETVARLAMAAGASEVRILDPLKLWQCLGSAPQSGDDAVDWVAAHGDSAEPEEMWQQIQAVIDQTEPWKPRPAETSKPQAATVTLPPDTLVMARDRGNFGTVIEDRGESCLVHFVSPDGQKADVELPKSKLARPDGTPLTSDGEAENEPPSFVQLMDCPAFLAADFRQEFLVKDILVAGQPMVVGGRSKTLKTSIVCDLVVSLGSGTSLLGEFAAQQVNIAFWSGESGAAVIRETAKRIAASKGIDLATCSIHWAFDLPKLGSAKHLDAMEEVITERKLQVIVVDPLYLSLLSAEDVGRSSDLFAMGAKLQPLSEMAQRTGVTPILLHHFRKNSSVQEDEPVGLEELAQSGVGEWARQWLLLRRRGVYNHDGHHQLWMRAGGSAGHAGMWSLDIEEGVLNPDDFSGRTWHVQVNSITDTREATATERQEKREKAKAAQKEAIEREHLHKLFAALKRFGDGETKTRLRGDTGLNDDNFEIAIATLMRDGYAEECTVEKHKRQHPGYRLTEAGKSENESPGHSQSQPVMTES